MWGRQAGDHFPPLPFPPLPCPFGGTNRCWAVRFWTLAENERGITKLPDEPLGDSKRTWIKYSQALQRVQRAFQVKASFIYYKYIFRYFYVLYFEQIQIKGFVGRHWKLHPPLKLCSNCILDLSPFKGNVSNIKALPIFTQSTHSCNSLLVSFLFIWNLLTECEGAKISSVSIHSSELYRPKTGGFQNRLHDLQQACFNEQSQRSGSDPLTFFTVITSSKQHKQHACCRLHFLRLKPSHIL